MGRPGGRREGGRAVRGRGGPGGGGPGARRVAPGAGARLLGATAGGGARGRAAAGDRRRRSLGRRRRRAAGDGWTRSGAGVLPGGRSAGTLLEPDRGAGGAGRRHGNGREDRHLRRRPGAEPAGARRGGRGSSPRGAGAAREHVGEHRGRSGEGERRREHREVGFALGDRRLEAAAGPAVAQVRAHAAPSEHPPVGVRERAADVVTRHGPALGALVQRRPRLEDRLLDRPCGGAQHDRDLVVAQAVELAQDQGGSLALRQVREVRLELRQAAAVLHLPGQAVGPQCLRRLQGRGRAPAAQDRDRLVVDDPEQPRPHLEVPLLALQRHEGLRHRALQRVLDVLVVAQDGPGVARELLVVAPVQRRERPFVPPDRERPQRRPAPEPEQGRGRRQAGRHLPRGTHGSHIGNARARLESGSIRPA